MNVRAITIDLDDTLWPIAPAIVEAERHGYAWMAEHTPRVTEKYTLDDIVDVRTETIDSNPQYAHDFTRLRKLALHKILDSCGYEASWVDRVFEEFFRKRNEVELFPDVLPALEALAERFPIASLSNGNADLERIGISHLFTVRISSREIGVAKPHPDLFCAACEALGCTPSEVVHIGDHQTQDVLGALGSGFRTIWLNRTGEDWQHSQRADAEVENLSDVLNMLL